NRLIRQIVADNSMIGENLIKRLFFIIMMNKDKLLKSQGVLWKQAENSINRWYHLSFQPSLSIRLKRHTKSIINSSHFTIGSIKKGREERILLNVIGRKNRIKKRLKSA